MITPETNAYRGSIFELLRRLSGSDSRFGCGDTTGVISRLVLENGLNIVFQPLVDLKTAHVYAHEALVRGPKESAYHSPAELLRIAAEENYLAEFEIICAIKALEEWAKQGNGGRIFINVSATALAKAFSGSSVEQISNAISYFGVSPRKVIFEITEYEHISNVPDLLGVTQKLHQAGVRFALDDFGDGRSSLRLWVELEPKFVKIDKYFTKDIAKNPLKIKTIRSLIQMAENLKTSLVAEGIETEQDLAVLRDLGLDLGQGHFLGWPESLSMKEVPAALKELLQSKRVAVMPVQGLSFQKIAPHSSMIIYAPAVTAQTTSAQVMQIFVDNPEFHALAVVNGAQPIAILSRGEFLTESSKPYFNELFGKKSCMRFANNAPRTVEVDQNVSDLIGILTSEDQRYLSDGFVYTQNGQYVGIGMGAHLVRLVTETRIEAARHANPLTYLPGNIPISEHIERLMARGTQFVVAYADLSNFKPFNDQYGYWQGDQAIKLVASKLAQHIDPQRDFLGHVGGDDFLVIFQSEDWQDRLRGAIQNFNTRVKDLYDSAGIEAGGIHAEDRHGVRRFFPFTKLYAGAVHYSDALYANASDISTAAASARHVAKTHGFDIYAAHQETSIHA